MSFEAFDVPVRRRRHTPLAAAIDLLAGLRRVERVGHVRANAGGVFLDGEHAAPRDAIARAYLVPREGAPPVVVLETHAATIEVYVRTAEQGESLLRATGHAVSQSVATFEGVLVESGARRTGLRLAALAFPSILVALLFAYAPSPPWLFAAVLAFGATVLWIVPDGVRSIVVGSDGLSVGEATGFVPFSSVVDVRAASARAAIVTIRGAADLRFTLKSSAERAAFVRRANAAADHARGAAPSSRETATLLASGTRPAEVWLRDLRALRDDARSDYRSAALPAEDLWRVVEDPAAPSSARAGAALGLRATLDASGRERLRVAAEACASPRLRVALDTAATTDDEPTVERAVGRCTDDVPP